jgi:hypothetical protein
MAMTKNQDPAPVIGAPEPDTTRELRVILRLPGLTVMHIRDAALAAPVRRSQHQWIMEAIAEKLARDAGPAVLNPGNAVELT